MILPRGKEASDESGRWRTNTDFPTCARSGWIFPASIAIPVNAPGGYYDPRGFCYTSVRDRFCKGGDLCRLRRDFDLGFSPLIDSHRALFPVSITPVAAPRPPPRFLHRHARPRNRLWIFSWHAVGQRDASTRSPTGTPTRFMLDRAVQTG